MARIRSIKPEFFLHEGLAELSPLHRLVFIGLWTLADREGRLDDRPRRIKAALMPWEACDMDAVLQGLNEAGFLFRYEVGGERYLEIHNFKKHQRPHPKEAKSELPGPGSREKVVSSREKVGSFPSAPVGREGDLCIGKEISESHASAPPPSEPTPPQEPIAEATDEPEPSKKQKAARELSTQEKFSAWFEDARRESLGSKYIPDEKWSVPKINTQLDFVKHAPPELIARGVELFIADPWAQGLDPPCPLSAFAKQWSKWVSKASRERAA